MIYWKEGAYLKIKQLNFFPGIYAWKLFIPIFFQLPENNII